MKKNIGSAIILMIVFSLSLLTSCQSIRSADARDEFDTKQAADNKAYRWLAMARWYERHGLLTRGEDKMDVGDIDAYRWLAMARWYEHHGLLTRGEDKMDAGDIDAYRWLAMARWYERHGLLNDK